MENQWPSISKILSRQEITLKCAEFPEAAMVIKKSENYVSFPSLCFPTRNTDCPSSYERTNYPSGRTWANIRYSSCYSSLVYGRAQDTYTVLTNYLPLCDFNDTFFGLRFNSRRSDIVSLCWKSFSEVFIGRQIQSLASVNSSSYFSGKILLKSFIFIFFPPQFEYSRKNSSYSR